MKSRTPEEMREYQRQRRAALRGEDVTPEAVTPQDVTPVCNTLEVYGPHTHTCPDCELTWRCSFVQDGICWRDPRCATHTPVPVLADLYEATGDQWTNAYNLIQEAKDRASTAGKQRSDAPPPAVG